MNIEKGDVINHIDYGELYVEIVAKDGFITFRLPDRRAYGVSKETVEEWQKYGKIDGTK